MRLDGLPNELAEILEMPRPIRPKGLLQRLRVSLHLCKHCERMGIRARPRDAPRMRHMQTSSARIPEDRPCGSHPV